MAAQFHNLAGLARDLRAIQAARAAGDERANALWATWLDGVEWALEEIEGPGLADDAEGSDTDASDELEGDEPELSVDDGGQHGRHDARSGAGSAAASVLDTVLDGMAGSQRAAAIAELDALRRDAMAGAGVTRAGKQLKLTARPK